MLSILNRIGAELDKRNILWGVGGSLLLKEYGLADSTNDIDLLVGIKDVARADDILSWLGRKNPSVKNTAYSTKFFSEYDIDGIEVDVMAGLMVNHDSGTYELVFDKDSISQFVRSHGVSIPFAALEDWFVLYQMMPGNQSKADLIENYLRTHGISKPFLLNRALEGNLPVQTKERIRHLLGGE